MFQLPADKPYLFAIDTSCDETSLAILDAKGQVLINLISSQVKLHAEYGGVVPEVASREHMEKLSALFAQCLKETQIQVHQLGAIAVTQTPGLVGCLLVGTSFAKSLAYRCQIPLLQVNHLQAHLLSPFILQPEVFPFLGLVVSGGHTAFYRVTDFDSIELLGQTVDDAAGEVYDKVAKILDLGYPGGPVVDKKAQLGNDTKYKFKIAKVKMGKQFLSFSGLKTAVFQTIQGQKMKEQDVNDLCASVQKNIVQTLCQKAEYFLQKDSYKAFALSGGVAMNSLLRQKVQELCQEQKIQCFIAEKQFCMDNAAMVGYCAFKMPHVADVFALNAQASQKIQARDIK